MTSIQPELRVECAADAVAFHQAAFGAIVLHRVGGGEDIVAQLAIGDAAFWVARIESAGAARPSEGGRRRHRAAPCSLSIAIGRNVLDVSRRAEATRARAGPGCGGSASRPGRLAGLTPASPGGPMTITAIPGPQQPIAVTRLQ